MAPPTVTEKSLERIRQTRLAHLREALAAEVAVARETKSDCEDVCQQAEQIDDAFLISALQKDITGLKATNRMIEDQNSEMERSLTGQQQVESELRVLRNTLLQRNQGVQDSEANDLQDYVTDLLQTTTDFAKETFPVTGKATFWQDFLQKPESIMCPDKKVANVLVSIGVATKKGEDVLAIV